MAREGLTSNRPDIGRPRRSNLVLVVTGSEPTTHLKPDGSAVLRYPPPPRTLPVTVAPADEVCRMGARLSVFLLGEVGRLAEFVDVLAAHAEVLL